MDKKLLRVLLPAALGAIIGCTETTIAGPGSFVSTSSHAIGETENALVGLSSVTEEREGSDTVVARVEAKVKSVDRKNRVVVLQGVDGKESPLKVSDAVKRLDEINPGDTVSVEYFASMVHELRAPTPEELKKPLVVMEGADREPATSAPGAYAVRSIRAVVTVTGIDAANQTVDIRGPEGRTVRIQVKRPERLKQLKVGDKALLGYTEGVAIAVEPKKPK